MPIPTSAVTPRSVPAMAGPAIAAPVVRTAGARSRETVGRVAPAPPSADGR